MIEIFDRKDTSFLKLYQNGLLSADDKVGDQGYSFMKNIPMFKIQDSDFIEDFMSNYQDVYPGWIRLKKFSYIFRFKPDTDTMLPHIDMDIKSAEILSGIVKRVLVYANIKWDSSWGGGTYFSAYENYGINRHNIAKCKREKFEREARLAENVPGRMVVFDPSEIHMPQRISGNTEQRLAFAAMIIHPEYSHLIDYLVSPSDNGNVRIKLELPEI
jgi:hypothetical protein